MIEEYKWVECLDYGKQDPPLMVRIKVYPSIRIPRSKAPKFVKTETSMINREEQLAKIKQQIARAIGEVEHGDQAAALLALVDAFKIREELYETDYERRVAQQMLVPIVVGPGEGDHPRVSEVKEAQPAARIKVTKR